MGETTPKYALERAGLCSSCWEQRLKDEIISLRFKLAEKKGSYRDESPFPWAKPFFPETSLENWKDAKAQRVASFDESKEEFTPPSTPWLAVATLFQEERISQTLVFCPLWAPDAEEAQGLLYSLVAIHDPWNHNFYTLNISPWDERNEPLLKDPTQKATA